MMNSGLNNASMNCGINETMQAHPKSSLAAATVLGGVATAVGMFFFGPKRAAAAPVAATATVPATAATALVTTSTNVLAGS